MGQYLAIATNIPQRLKTGFVVQGHILYISNPTQYLNIYLTNY